MDLHLQIIAKHNAKIAAAIDYCAARMTLPNAYTDGDCRNSPTPLCGTIPLETTGFHTVPDRGNQRSGPPGSTRLDPALRKRIREAVGLRHHGPHPDAHRTTRTLLSFFGDQFLKGFKEPDRAVRYFELNVDAYPGSSSAWANLAAAYEASGDKERAITTYERSLQLNPQNENAKRMLKTLRDQ